MLSTEKIFKAKHDNDKNYKRGKGKITKFDTITDKFLNRKTKYIQKSIKYFLIDHQK